MTKEDIEEPYWSNLGPFILATTGPVFSSHHKVYRVVNGKRGEMIFEGNSRELNAWSNSVCSALEPEAKP